ncbi:MAG: cytochrome P450 [Planctomycetales bacterium]
MTDRQLRDEVMTLFLAGHETTALTLSWAWYAITQHPEVQRKLQEEVDRVLGDRPCTMDDVPQLKYAEHILLETFRLYPPAYIIGREAIEPCEIGGYPIEKGMTVLMAQWSMHRDPRFWDDPLEFRPERWENDLQKRLPRIVYFPFGGGPRTCIGNTFAMLEATMVLATLIQRFQFTAVPGLTVAPKATFTLKPNQPLRMIVTPRKKS